VVSITFAGGAAVGVIPDANGNIVLATTVPPSAVPGPTNVLMATDANGNAAAPATFMVPKASVAVDPVEGSAGGALTVTGSGFPGYAGVTVEFGLYTIPTTVLTGPLGTFSLATTVPGVAPGLATVVATAGGMQANTVFNVKLPPTTISSQLASIADNLVIVWGYIDGVWEWFDPVDEGSTLESMDAGTGYWVQVLEAVELIFGGTSYDLDEDWNLIGWTG
jgi:hypothetical protein